MTHSELQNLIDLKITDTYSTEKFKAIIGYGSFNNDPNNIEVIIATHYKDKTKPFEVEVFKDCVHNKIVLTDNFRRVSSTSYDVIIALLPVIFKDI